MSKEILSLALAGLLSVATAASAAEPADNANKEKCYGIAEKGKNDCKAKDGSHSCKGAATKDKDMNDWVFVDKGECTKKGGKTDETANNTGNTGGAVNNMSKKS